MTLPNLRKLTIVSVSRLDLDVFLQEHRMIRHGSVLIFIGLVLCAVGPVPTAAQVLETSDGKIEFIGLHHWTPEQVRDTLAALQPDLPLNSGACAAVLRLQAGFPAAAVHRYSSGDGHFEDHVLITLVEPEAAEQVRFGSMPPDSLGPIDRWAEAYEFLEGMESWAWGLALQYRRRSPPPEVWSRLEGIDSTRYLEVRSFLDDHSTEEDLDLALDVLAQDRTGLNRAIAVGILSGFPHRDEAWHALVRAARGFGPLDGGRDAAAMMINSMTWEVPETLDWRPVADDLAALLNGTNLFAFMPLLEVLSRTGSPPDMTRELLADGAPLVIDHLAAKSPMPRQAARLFLERVSGEEHGDDVEAWKVWMSTL
jgi:hypothetical protein